MKKCNCSRCLVALTAMSSLALVSCVNNDYDLSKDIDMNVTVGGNLTLPPSNTENYTMGQILNLDGNSSIKPVGADYGLSAGDYVLVQDGNTSPSTFKIDKVRLNELNSTPSTTELKFYGVGTDLRVFADVVDLTNTLHLKDDNVDDQLVSLKSADVDITLNITIDFNALDNYNGHLYIDPGFKVAFPDFWTIENNLNDGCGIEDNHILIFETERIIPAGSSLELSVTVTHIDLSNIPADQGLYAPGKFDLTTNIVSNGRVGIDNGSLALGEATRVSLTALPQLESAVINAFTGCVNPDINVDATSFTISDVPDFLKEDGNNLDIENPRINLVVENNSPVEVNINAMLEGFYSNGAPFNVGIGENNGTAPVVIKGNGKTVICLSRLGVGADVAAGEVNVAIPGLGNLISTIPDRIEMKNIEAKVPQNKDYVFDLGRTYDFTVNYKAIVPLAFGPDLKFNYNTSDDGWDSDLDKYNFDKVIATITVENTTPLNMVPRVTALGKNGQHLTDIKAEVTGTVAAGKLGAPSTSKLEIVLSSTADNIGELDGVEFDFEATSDPSVVGVPLNEGQSLKFTEVVLKLVGGVSIDLN